MDKLLQQLRQLTEVMISTLEEAAYEDLTEFIQKREQLVNLILKVPLTSQEKQKYRAEIQSILEADSLIQSKMRSLKDEAARELNKVDAGRKQKNAYSQEYSPIEGAFFDRKN